MNSVAYQESPGQQMTALPAAYTNRWVRSIELPAGAFLVPGRIPYGIWSHSAEAGGYKSAFASQIEHHIAYGHPIPGLDWRFEQCGDCLVITPDESVYEIQDRTYAIIPGGVLPTDGHDHSGRPAPGPECDIHYRHLPRGGSLNQRIAWMTALIEEIEQQTGRKIVWIRWDTIGSLLGDRQGVDHYTHAMPLQMLGAWLASSARVLFLPNHIGKDGRSIGTVGIDGSSNLVTKTEITRASNEGTLDASKVRGGQLWSAALILRGAILELNDLSPQVASHGVGTLPRHVLAFLADRPEGATSAEIIEGTHIERGTCWRVIMRCKAAREIHNDGGVWSLTDQGRTSASGEMGTSLPHDRLDRLDRLDGLDGLDTTPQTPQWTTCPGCGSVVYPGLQCTTITCRTPPVPPAEDSIQQCHDVAATAPPPRRGLPEPPWKAHARRAPAPAELPRLESGWHMEGDKKVWDHSPIAAAIDMIMEDRDAGRLSPRWRCELPDEVRQLQAEDIKIIDGGHHHGRLPVRRRGQITAQPPGPWVSYDVIGSFLASYKTHVSLKELTEYTGEWTPKAGGLILQRTPEWLDSRIGHPYGRDARPGELQLIWQPTMRLAMKLAGEGLWQPPVVERMWLRTGYQGASEALFEGFTRRMRLARETYPKGSDESDYCKAMYSQWLSSAAEGKRNVFKREDWTGSVRAESFGPRLWWKGWSAVAAGAVMWGMGNTDEICFRPAPLLDTLFPPDDPHIGKLTIKDWGGD
jgi:hypothetical protein